MIFSHSGFGRGGEEYCLISKSGGAAKAETGSSAVKAAINASLTTGSPENGQKRFAAGFSINHLANHHRQITRQLGFVHGLARLPTNSPACWPVWRRASR